MPEGITPGREGLTFRAGASYDAIGGDPITPEMPSDDYVPCVGQMGEVECLTTCPNYEVVKHFMTLPSERTTEPLTIIAMTATTAPNCERNEGRY